MTDLGFGIVDRRSVLAILLAIFVSATIIGNPIPIDTSTAPSLFTSLVVLTGFIYITRSIGRIIIALICAFLFTPLILYEIVKSTPSHINIGVHGIEERRNFGKILQDTLSGLKRLIWNPLAHEQEWERGYTIHFMILGVLDRLAFIGLVVLYTFPQLSATRQVIGITGIVLMLLVYILKGGFTLVLKDAIKKAEEDHSALIPRS